MTITKVSYGKTFNLGSYSSERIDMECEITEDESPVMALASLKDIVHGFHIENNKGLYIERTDYVPDTHVGNISQQPELQSINTEKISPEQEIEDTLKGIEESTAETLPTFRIKSSQNIKTLGAYNRRKKQLNIS